ncbi:Negative regulator of transcription, partial [Pseudoloma neurophilia]
MTAKQSETLLSCILENEGSYTDSVTLDALITKIKQKREISDGEVTDLIIHIVNDKKEWHVPELINTIKSLLNINWVKIYEKLDSPNLIIDIRSFNKILKIWSYISDNQSLPYHTFFTQWENKEAQEQFLIFYIENRENIIDIRNNIYLKPIIPLSDLEFEEEIFTSSSSVSQHSSEKRTVVQCDLIQTHFNCIELFECISKKSKKLSDLLIRKIIFISPEWGFFGLSTIFPTHRTIFEELFLSNLKREKFSILGFLDKRDPAFLIQCLSDARDNGFSLNKLLDITLELKLLPSILEYLHPPFFCFEILILSSKRDHLNLNIWISNTFKNKGDAFVQGMIAYITEKTKQSTNNGEHISNEPFSMYISNQT